MTTMTATIVNGYYIKTTIVQLMVIMYNYHGYYTSGIFNVFFFIGHERATTFGKLASFPFL